jgi:iron complex outermembrane receptor protein
MPYSWALANTTAYDLSDNVTIKNTFGYHRYKASNFETIDGSTLPFIAYGADTGGWELNNEVQLAGSTPGFNWIAGVYFFKEKGYNSSYTPDLLGFFNTLTPTSNYEQARNESLSLFASATKEILPDLSLTVGGRYTWDKRAVSFGTRTNIDLVGGGICQNSATSGSYAQYNASFDAANCLMSMNTKFKKFTYTTSLDWEITPRQLLYIAHRKGYRSGGFNTRATDPSAYGIFRPELVKDVEAGFKSTFDLGSDMRLRTNVAAYYQWYSDIQRLLTFSPCPTCVQQTVVQNAASANIYGGEFEANLSVGDWLTLYGTMAIVRPSYNDFVFQGVDYAKTATFGGSIRNQFSAGATINLPTIGDIGDPRFLVNWYKQSGFYNQDNVTSEAAARVPGYATTNVRFELAKIGAEDITFGLSVNNVFDKHYLRSIFSLYNQMGFASGTYALPRTWNADLRFNF